MARAVFPSVFILKQRTQPSENKVFFFGGGEGYISFKCSFGIVVDVFVFTATILNFPVYYWKVSALSIGTSMVSQYFISMFFFPIYLVKL